MTKTSEFNDSTFLIVDDEPDLLRGLSRSLSRRLDGMTILLAHGGKEALEIISSKRIDIVLLDMKMDDLSGMEVLEEINRLNEDLTVIMMTAFGSIPLAVEAIHAGAWDFVTKPIDLDALARLLKKGIERSRLIKENIRLLEQLHESDTPSHFVGDSAVMRQLYRNIKAVAASDYTVLIRGASGTGKEIAANMIHRLSSRKNKPFVMVNCPAIPEQLLESELFGHRKGAFTGADHDHEGMFVQANGGTICLDEIGDIPVSIQTKLLRVLQNKEVKPLGSNNTRPVDVRILASTNQNLEEHIENQTFREDLFYRLNVVTIATPWLRDIPEDIPLIADHFLRQACRELQCSRKTLSNAALQVLERQPWPGNCRQLQNVIRRAAVFSRGETVEPEHFADLTPPEDKEDKSTSSLSRPYKEAKEACLSAFSERYITDLLKSTKGNVSEAARRSELTRAALQKIMKRQGIHGNSFKV
ncbi:MAG: sigma-54 dependent transcriptional regulator [Desulfocapsaceae bacterium]|nr:sigma-54 dependent transcriptional regulator [Desulfocapsaceae bacterium]